MSVPNISNFILAPKVFSNWVYSIAWVSVWPILFAIFNLAMNFYLYSSTPIVPMCLTALKTWNLPKK